MSEITNVHQADQKCKELAIELALMSEESERYESVAKQYQDMRTRRLELALY
jgi:hypothetical protein